MVFQPISKDDVTDPIVSPHGETVYELVGLAAQKGGVREHSLAYVVIAPGKVSLNHYHKLSQETYYLLQGSGLIRIDAAEYSLKPGQALLILPNQRHQIVNTGAGDLVFLAVCVPAWYPEDSYYV